MSELTFDQELVLVLIGIIIPTVAGIFTTKWITNSWQEKKEKLELRKQILEEFNATIPRLMSLYYSVANVSSKSVIDEEIKKIKQDYYKKHNIPRNLSPQEEEEINNQIAIEGKDKLYQRMSFLYKEAWSRIEGKLNTAIEKSLTFEFSLCLYFKDYESLQEDYSDIRLQIFSWGDAINQMRFKENLKDDEFMKEFDNTFVGDDIGEKIRNFSLKLTEAELRNPKS